MHEKAATIAPPKKYRVQELSDKVTEGLFCIKVLFVPMAHPELSTIFHVRAIVKRTVPSQNLTFNQADVDELTKRESALLHRCKYGRKNRCFRGFLTSLGRRISIWL